MRKYVTVLVAAWTLGSFAPVTATLLPSLNFVMPVANAAGKNDNKMAQITLIIRKLTESMASLKDLDALQKAGMPKKDVDRMRQALEQKNQQMINQAVAEIQSL